MSKERKRKRVRRKLRPQLSMVRKEKLCSQFML